MTLKGKVYQRSRARSAAPSGRASQARRAKAVGLENAQGLHHFISQSPSKAEDLETRRLK